MRSSFSSYAAAAVTILAAAAPATAQYNQTRNLTPDGYWHNRYHQLVSMAVYGNYNSTCPIQTFTEAAKIKNFPSSTRAPWTIIETWNTPSGCVGFSAVVPEMNKVLMVFRGNLAMEQNLPLDVVPWGQITTGLGSACSSCTANAYAVKGYLEARNATNNWSKTRNAYYGQGLVYSITGHGLGGMHSLIASVDFNQQDIAWYSHNYGTPRTFNPAGVNWYNQRFNGEAGERGIFANDQSVNLIPSSANYAHAGTSFYYWGTNSSTGSPNWQICWDDNDASDPACQPGAQVSNNFNTNSTQDHYFYWGNVGECGGPNTITVSIVNDFLRSNADTDSSAVFENAAISEAVKYASSIYSGPTYDGGSDAVPSSASAATTNNVRVTYTTTQYSYYTPSSTVRQQTTQSAPAPTTRYSSSTSAPAPGRTTTTRSVVSFSS